MMGRLFDRRAFRETFDRWIVHGRFNEIPSYYPRYRSRYEGIVKLYSELAGPAPLDVLDIGGGQYALLTHKLWEDRAAVADVVDDHLDYVRSCGVATHHWNLAEEDAPFDKRFDVVVFSEVIEHLPIPGYIALQRLRRVLKPHGLLICTTPNFYRLRNVVYVAIGKRIYDHFKLPGEGPLGHVIEYDQKRLEWAMQGAGFRDVSVELRQFPHQPNDLVFRIMSWIGSPLFLVPRFRDTMIAVGTSED
jgi:2-polyprenyl-3-methyl-5-hydroxy-6-metoxy-1,4-benzoquinol methylase